VVRLQEVWAFSILESVALEMPTRWDLAFMSRRRRVDVRRMFPVGHLSWLFMLI